MKWVYYYRSRYNPEFPTNYRRTAGGVYEQLKSHMVWGFSEAMFIEDSVQVPDLLLVLNGYPT